MVSETSFSAKAFEQTWRFLTGSAPAALDITAENRIVLDGKVSGLGLNNGPGTFANNLPLVGATLGGYSRDVMRAMDAETHAAVMQLWRAGTFRPVTTEQIDFAAVPDALAAMGERRTLGRVVVRVDPR